METVRAEGSLVASLAELKRIEQQRIADEQAAFQRAVEERKAAQEEAERRERAAAEAKAKAELQALLAAEEARAAAEREARMRVQVAEAAEHARAQALIEQQRVAVELELRREAIARKRPTWMVVVTAGAMVAAAVLAWAALSWKRRAEVSVNAAAAAITEKNVAQEEAKRKAASLAQIESDLALYAQRVAEAERQVRIAQTDADRARALDKLARLKEERRKLLPSDPRPTPKKPPPDQVTIDPACLKNPLCTKP
jgi:hypothetical protein